jgi:predicted metal-binding membrane protein
VQHRLVVISLRPASVTIAIAGAWLLLVALTLTGHGGVIRHDRLLQGGPPLWLAAAVFVAGWQVMVWAMMAPASLHALWNANFRFIGGYVAVWTAFGLAIFLADAGLHFAVGHWAWVGERAWLIPGGTLVLCGTYQLSNLKARSLEACLQPPWSGVRHGLDCVGSSGGLMLLSFALAAANLVLMAAVTLAMVYEVSPWGRAGVKPLGYGLIAVGVGAIALAL